MKNSDIKNLLSIISGVKDNIINIYIEQKKESQVDYYLKSKAYKKQKNSLGARIIIKNHQDIVTFFKSFNFTNTKDLFFKIYEIICNNCTFTITHSKNIKIKKNKQKKYRINFQKKNRIKDFAFSIIGDLDSARLSFYDMETRIIVMQSNINYVNDINYLYSRIRLFGTIKNCENFDFAHSINGYNYINKSFINKFCNNFLYHLNCKNKAIKFSDGIYDIMFSNNCGTVFHEVFGHNLELDNIERYNIKAFSKGNDIGNSLISYYDCPNYEKKINIVYDDYLKRTRNKLLIQNGIIKGNITTYVSENYSYFPYTRMTNSYLKPLKLSNLKKFKNYIYVEKIKYGRLDLENQTITVVIDLGFLMCDGNISNIIKDLTFTIDVMTFIKKISYIGNDLKFVPTICGSYSGNIFQNVGCPTVFVNSIFVKKYINEKMLKMKL